MRRALISSAATKVRNSGLGKAMMERQKMASRASKMYCASHIDQWCFRSDLMVSAGDIEVSRWVMEEAGELAARMRDLVARHFLRSLRGTRRGNIGEEELVVALRRDGSRAEQRQRQRERRVGLWWRMGAG